MSSIAFCNPTGITFVWGNDDVNILNCLLEATLHVLKLHLHFFMKYQSTLFTIKQGFTRSINDWRNTSSVYTTQTSTQSIIAPSVLCNPF